MRTWTNLAWPDDPYGTGQRLYRRPAQRLAAFTTWPAVAGGQPVPVTTAIVYLPLHRTQPVTVTGQTLTFGFRAASATDQSEIPGVAAVADLDLMQARRHAAVLAGYHLADDLAALQRADGGAVWRGLAAVAGDWATRSPAAGRARLFDCGLDLPGSLPLEQACLAGRHQPHGRRHRLARTVASGDADGGAGAGGCAAVRPAPGPLRMGRDAAHPGGDGRLRPGLPALAGDSSRMRSLTRASARRR